MKTVILIFSLFIAFLLQYQAESITFSAEKYFDQTDQQTGLNTTTHNLLKFEENCCVEEISDASICHIDCKFFTSPFRITLKSYLDYFEVTEIQWRINNVINLRLRPPIL